MAKPLMSVKPVVLQGLRVRLVPLSVEHVADLMTVAFDEDLWRWTLTSVRNADDLKRYIEAALIEQDQGRALPFATVDRTSGRAIGSTRYGNVEPAHRRVEIGWTWIGKRWQRTAVNTEAKYLMLKHAFETLGCHRVELKTNTLNQRSRDAIVRIGGKEEGTLRKHAISDRGEVRDTIYYSILDDEWPAVKTRLESMMARTG
jgi:RimJ/RimL family protein N-acetyltransferase